MSTVARRAFLWTPYAANAEGVMVASMPTSCPLHEAGDEPCRLRVDHHRERKTEPKFALTVVRCGLHAVACTLYPPGHVPYGRVAIAPVSSDGALLKDAPSSEPPAAEALEAPTGQPSFSDTLFGAATDAAAGRAWSRKNSAEAGHWRTQGRRLMLCAQLVGLAPMTADGAVEHHEQMARHLGVPTLMLVEQASQWNNAHGYRERGAAITAVLNAMGASRRILDRLMCAGAFVGLWGRPSRWYPDPGVLRRPPFW